MITSILIIAILVFVVTCLFPGMVVSHIVLRGFETKKYSLLKRCLIGGAISAFTGITCTIAFFVLVPVAIMGIVLITVLVIISEVAGMMHGR